MRIGVISDTHDQFETVRAAVKLLTELEVELVLHCGDIQSPDAVRLFEPLRTHFVFGNWDGRTAALLDAMEDVGATHHPDFGHLYLAGKDVGWVHSHKKGQLREMEQSGLFDFLFYGHTHVAESHRVGRTLVANPGALERAMPKTFLLADLEKTELRWIKIV
jgi:uncharacterized protein